MKKFTITLMMTLVMAITCFAQPPPRAFKYQAVARDNSGNALASQDVLFRVGILQGSTSGNLVYSETHAATTNPFGLVNLEIGNGTVVSGVFANIDWGADTYFLQIEMDDNGSFQLIGSSQLLSVPYALYAESTGDTTRWLKNNNDLYYNNGNVGIGNISPTTKLDVNGKLRVRDVSLDNTQDSVLVVSGDGTVAYRDASSLLDAYVSGPASSTDNDIVIYDGISGKVIKQSGFTLTTNNALHFPTSNTIIGSQTAGNPNTGNSNTLIGFRSGWSAGSTDNNTFVGSQAGYKAVSNANVGFGFLSCGGATATTMTGESNTFVGTQSGANLTTGSYNTASGFAAMNGSTTGNFNAAYGANALAVNTGASNVAIGSNSLKANTSGFSNSSLGHSSLFYNTEGNYNTGIGEQTLYLNTAGDFNTALGSEAGYSSIGNSNVFIGYQAGYNEIGSNKLYIENSNSTTPLIYGDFVEDKIQINGELNIRDLALDNASDSVLVVSGDGTIAYRNTSTLTIAETDPSVPVGTLAGQTQYWNGTAWATVAPGSTGQVLTFVNGVPTWTTTENPADLLVKSIQELSANNDAKDLAILDLQNQLNEINQRFEMLVDAPDLKVGTTATGNNVLFQNQPNPFNQSTVIPYSITSEASNAKIVIRNLNGSLVKQVAISQPGKGQVTINANELAQGTYTYTLEIAGVSFDTKLMVVTK